MKIGGWRKPKIKRRLLAASRLAGYLRRQLASGGGESINQ